MAGFPNFEDIANKLRSNQPVVFNNEETTRINNVITQMRHSAQGCNCGATSPLCGLFRGLISHCGSCAPPNLYLCAMCRCVLVMSMAHVILGCTKDQCEIPFCSFCRTSSEEIRNGLRYHYQLRGNNR